MDAQWHTGSLVVIDGAGGRWLFGDVPLELVGQVAGAGAVAEAGDIEGGAAAARHGATSRVW